MIRPTTRLALCITLVLPGCAQFGGKSSKNKSVSAWQKDAKAQARAQTPEAEGKLVRSLDQQNQRVTRMGEQVSDSTAKAGDLLLGKTSMAGLPASPFEKEARVLTQHIAFPQLLPFEQRSVGKFFKPISGADAKKLKKLYKDRELQKKISTSFQSMQAAGYSILLEQNRAAALNWSAELMALYQGSKVIAFERTVDTKVGDDALASIADALASRDQSRALLVTHTGALAVFEGVSQGGDPKAITTLAEAMKQQAAAKPKISNEDARAFLDSLQGEALDLAGALEAGMRAAVGDKSYENAYQSQLVKTLQQIEEAQNEVSVYEQIDQQAKVAKRQELKQLAKTAKERLVARAKELGVEKAKEIVGNIPGGSQLLAGLRAIKELRAGNPRGAIEAAMEAVPPGGIGSAIRSASTIAFGAADNVKRRRRRG